MRIYAIYRHYWPDTPSYARLLKSIAERLASDGHTVTVFTAQPSYNDVRQAPLPRVATVGGVLIVRMPLFPEKKSIVLSRVVNSMLFVGGALAYGLVRFRHDLAMAPSTPPALMGLTLRGLAFLGGSRYLYHCQDLQPEAAVLGGKFDKGLLYRILMRAEKSAHRGAQAVVVLSEDMARAVRERGLPGDNIRVLNNFSLELFDRDAAVPNSLARRSPDAYRVLFAGNHGNYQGLEHVIEAARLLTDRADIHFQFVGDGLVKPALIRQAGDMLDRTVFFHPYVSVEAAQKVMEDSDLGLIPLQKGIYKLAYPSKTMTLLAAGLPVLVVVEAESALARFVQREDIGMTCPPGDPRALADAILQGYSKRAELAASRERCRRVAEAEFGIAANLDKWSALMRELAPRAARA